MRNDEGTQEVEDEANDRAQIEGIIREFAARINARDFEALRSSPHFAGTLSSDFEFRQSHKDSMDSLIDAWEEHCKVPEYADRKVRLQDITTTFSLSRKEKRASAMLRSLMMDGDEKRLAIPGVTLMNLRKVDGVWRVVKISSMRGQDSDGSLDADESARDEKDIKEV